MYYTQDINKKEIFARMQDVIQGTFFIYSIIKLLIKKGILNKYFIILNDKNITLLVKFNSCVTEKGYKYVKLV